MSKKYDLEDGIASAKIVLSTYYAARNKQILKLSKLRYTTRQIGKMCVPPITGQRVGAILRKLEEEKEEKIALFEARVADQIALDRAKSRIPTLSKARKIKAGEL